MAMLNSPSPRVREIAKLMELYDISFYRASRWVDSPKRDELIARHLEQKQRHK